MIRSSFAGFTTAQLGMSASQSALNVIGQNISNINTNGYTRQRVDLSSFNVTTGPRKWGSINDTYIGNGVVVNKVEQVRDPYLDLRFRTEMASVGYHDEILSTLKDLESVLDEVDKAGSIHNQLEAVFKALNEFDPQAANNEFQNMAKTELQLLSQYFNTYSNSIKQTKEENLTLFKDQTIPNVNQLLKDITHLNASIKENEILGNPALELRDERNLLLDELSSYVKIEVTYEKKYLGLSENTADECTVKLLGVDDDGNTFKYTLIQHDKAAELQINDDCSHLTMTDVDGNPLADIGSALKPANGVPGDFGQNEVDKINTLLEQIQKLSTDVNKSMQDINKYNQQINSYGAKIVNLSKRGNELHSELRDVLKVAKSNQRKIDSLQEEYDALDDKTTPQAEELKAGIDKRNEIQKIYNRQLYGQDTKPANVNDVDPAGSGIYNKLIKIYGKITDDTTQPPTYEDTEKNGDIGAAKQALAQARLDLAAAREAFSTAVKNLHGVVEDGKDANGNPIECLKDYANITVDWQSYPVEGTKSFISLPVITLSGTSARDGKGITVFDPDDNIATDAPNSVIGKIAEFGFVANAAPATGGTVTITDTKKINYDVKTDTIDGSPYKLDPNTHEVVKDDHGNPVLDMTTQRNMYDEMQEDSGSIKASLDMFNRAGEFTADTDRGYDYYLNMLDIFARQIAKVFNEANMQNTDGSPLLDSNGKPIDYANALFGADGQIPVKNMTDANGKYVDYDGNPSDVPLPDVFEVDGDPTSKLDRNALAAFGIVQSKQEEYTDGNKNQVPPGAWVDKDGNLLLDKDGNQITDPVDADKDKVLELITLGAKDDPKGIKALEGKVPKIDYEQITASNFTITKDWAEGKTNFVQTHDPSQTAGYNDNINHLISVFSQKLNYTFTQPDGTQKTIFNGTFVEFYDNLGNQLGLDIKSSTVLVTNYITVANDIANNRDAISGVSLDEEGIDILRYQHSYNAAARLMTALDEELDKVINGMGVVGR